MNISYNGNWSLSNSIITFNDIPNILLVEDSTTGSKDVVTLKLDSSGLNAITTEDGQWYIKILDDTITNVLNPKDATSKTFYIADDLPSAIASLVKALRACPNIAANFVVEQKLVQSKYNIDTHEWVYIPAVVMTSRADGDFLPSRWLDTNIEVTYLTTAVNRGWTPEQGAYVDVDIYVEDTAIGEDRYITTLEKSVYQGSCAFNVTPVLSTLAEEGKAIPYKMNVTMYNPESSTPYSTIGTVSTNYIVEGYMCNQGQKYLELNRTQLAANYTRGKNRTFENNTLLYIYLPSIDFSFYNYDWGGADITVSYLDSAENVITSTTSTWRNTDSSKKLWDYHIGLNQVFLSQAFYVDVNIGSSMTLRYNVIKPLKAAEKAQRIYWRNSYGGISFFDFTGQKSETRNLDVTTYQKNIFDYYTGEDYHNELNKVYDNKVEYEVSLKSHLFEDDGKYIFNDLLQSSNVWTTINDVDYAIIIKSVSVEETNQDNVYEATVKYNYSQEPSEIQ